MHQKTKLAIAGGDTQITSARAAQQFQAINGVGMSVVVSKSSLLLRIFHNKEIDYNKILGLSWARANATRVERMWQLSRAAKCKNSV